MRIFLFTLTLLLVSFVFSGCHAAQEKAWDETMRVTNEKIQADEFLKKNVHHIELERRQFIRVYINPQQARANFAKVTFGVTQIAGETLFAQEGNKFKEITVFGNLIDGDEVIVCKYLPDSGATIEKDRTVQTM